MGVGRTAVTVVVDGRGQRVAVAHRARGRVVARQRQVAFAGIDHLVGRRQGQQLRQTKGRTTHGDTGNAVACRDRERPCDGLAGIAHRRQAMLIDCRIRPLGRRRHHAGVIVRPGDGNRQLGRTRVPVRIPHRVIQVVAQVTARRQRLHCSLAVIQRKAVNTVTAQRQHAITTQRCQSRAVVLALRTPGSKFLRHIRPGTVVCQYVAADKRRAVLGHAHWTVIHRSRGVVDDPDDQFVAGRTAANAQHADRDAVIEIGAGRTGVTVVVDRGGQRVAVTQRTCTGRAAVIGQGQQPFASVDELVVCCQGLQLRQAQAHPADRNAGNAVGGRYREGAAGGFAGVRCRSQAFFVDGLIGPLQRGSHYLGAVVGTQDGDGQGSSVQIAVGVLHRVAEGFRETLTAVQGLHRRVAVVQQVAVAAVAGVAEAAVAGRGAGPGDEAGRYIRPRLAVGVQVVAEHVAADRHDRVFGDAMAVVDRIRHIVDDVDVEGSEVSVMIHVLGQHGEVLGQLILTRPR
ncbi:hypothetical protein D3C84_496660 [compost metagenome]